MNIHFLVILVFFSSMLFSMLGIGGGMFYVMFLLLAGVAFHQAATASLCIIFVVSISALYVFLKNKLVDWKLAAVIDPPTDIMAFVGGYFSSYFSEYSLKTILVFVLIIAGFLMIKKAIPRPVEVSQKRLWIWRRNFNGREYNVNLLITLPITAGIGILAGMLGITGGIVKLPLMVVLCGVPVDIAIATSTVMVAITALFGIAGHALAGHLNFDIILPLVAAGFVGGQIGSRLSIKANKDILKMIIGIILIAFAVKLILELW